MTKERSFVWVVFLVTQLENSLFVKNHEYHTRIRACQGQLNSSAKQNEKIKKDIKQVVIMVNLQRLICNLSSVGIAW